VVSKGEMSPRGIKLQRTRIAFVEWWHACTESAARLIIRVSAQHLLARHDGSRRRAGAVVISGRPVEPSCPGPPLTSLCPRRFAKTLPNVSAAQRHAPPTAIPLRVKRRHRARHAADGSGIFDEWWSAMSQTPPRRTRTKL
jgi:hypothetical protein